MTESEQLKQNTNRQKVLSQLDEVGAYLDKLTAKIDYCEKRNRDAWKIYFIAWGAWVIAGFFSKTGNSIMEMVFLGALIYSFLRSKQLHGAHREFLGAIKILQILGMIPPRGGDGVENKREAWSEMADTVKGWFTSKKKVQEEMYAPA